MPASADANAQIDASIWADARLAGCRVCLMPTLRVMPAIGLMGASKVYC